MYVSLFYKSMPCNILALYGIIVRKLSQCCAASLHAYNANIKKINTYPKSTFYWWILLLEVGHRCLLCFDLFQLLKPRSAHAVSDNFCRPTANLLWHFTQQEPEMFFHAKVSSISSSTLIKAANRKLKTKGLKLVTVTTVYYIHFIWLVQSLIYNNMCCVLY